MSEIKIGEKVLATNDRVKWVEGVFIEEVDLFASYRVKLNSGETGLFVDIESNEIPEIPEMVGTRDALENLTIIK